MKIINSDEIHYIKPDLKDYLVQYNNKLAEILVKNYSLKYLVSATINRLEAQTTFFEYLEKYIQISSLLTKDKELYIQLSKKDERLFNPLREEFGSRVSRIKGTNEANIGFVFWFKLIAKFLLLLLFYTITRFKYHTSDHYDHVIRTYFDFRSRDKNHYLRDEFFGELPNDLKKNAKLLIVYKLIRRKEIINFLKSKTDGFDAVPLEYFITPLDAFKAFKAFLNSKIKFKDQFVYKDKNCTALLQIFLEKEYKQLLGLDALLEYQAAQNIFKKNATNLLMPYENQTWEKVYVMVKHQNNFNTNIIGYQHTGISFKLLNYFPSQLEMGLKIFPDKIITVGNIVKKVFSKYAFYPSKIVVGGALRFTKHFDNDALINIKPSQAIINKKIVYAFSYDRRKYTKIIDLLVEVFANAGIKVVLKFHPNYTQHSIIKNYGKTLPNGFSYSNKVTWKDLYKEADAILYDDNSIAFEGLINGIKTFSLTEGEEIYDITRAYYFTEWQESIDKSGLVKLRDSIVNQNFEKTIDTKNIGLYINDYFTKYEYKTHFKEFVS